MMNPFEDPEAAYLALVNQACLDYIDANWTDMRPASLIRAMEEAP